MEPESGVREPRRVVVASYDSYPEAQRAVDYLSDERFPVERVAIVAEDLRLVEQVTGRRGYGKAALQGAGSGALIGLIFGFFLGLFNVVDPLVSAFFLGIVWLIYGAIIGLIVGLIGHALSGGQRDFSSIGGIQAGRYNVMADEEVADEASQLLARPGSPSGDVQSRTATEPSSRTEEEVVPPSREGASPGHQRTGEVPLSEEQPERREAGSSGDLSREAPPSGERRPERRGEAPATDTPQEDPPPGEERPERRTP
jgi:Heat induced stress protein YflT domain